MLQLEKIEKKLVSSILAALTNNIEAKDIKLLLLEHGLPEHDIEYIISRIKGDFLFAFFKKEFQKREKLEALLELDYQLKKHLSNYDKIDSFDFLDARTFFKEYFYASKPVIVKNWTSDWPALKKWDLSFFKTIFGGETVEITFGRDTSNSYEIDFESFRKRVLLREYIEQIEKNPDSNNYYLVARNFLLSNPNFSALFNDFSPIRNIIDPSAHNDKGYVKMWIGPRGTITPLHHDRINVLLVQIVGRKLVKLIPPNQIHKVYNSADVFSELNLNSEINVNKFPKAKGLDVLQVVVQPGEALLIPVGWWHWVKSLDVSITLTHQQFCIPDGNILLIDNFE